MNQFEEYIFPAKLESGVDVYAICSWSFDAEKSELVDFKMRIQILNGYMGLDGPIIGKNALLAEWNNIEKSMRDHAIKLSIYETQVKT